MPFPEESEEVSNIESISPTMRTFSVRSEINQDIAASFYNDLIYQRTSFFYFLGKMNGWTDEIERDLFDNEGKDLFDNEDNDLYTRESGIEYSTVIAQSQGQSLYYTSKNERLIRDNIVHLQKVYGSDTSLVVRRIDWEHQKIFDQWDDTLEMYGKDFYCMNSNKEVFKCLYNNLRSPSYVEPKGFSTSPLRTQDGYVWKFMYSINETKERKFVSEEYIPVQKAITDTFYAKGAIENIEVLENGYGYIPTVLQQQSSNVVFGESSPLPVGGGVENQYDSDLNVDLESRAQVVIRGDGEGCKAEPFVNPFTGEIISVVVKEPGLGYTWAEAEIISKDAGSGAILKPIILDSNFVSEQAIVEQTVVDGEINAIEITESGTGYHPDTTKVEIEGDGEDFEVMYPIEVEDGKVKKIAVKNQGRNYTWMKISIVDDADTGRGAKARPIFPPYFRGHGFDAPSELFAETVCLYSELKRDPGMEHLSGKPFFQFGLLKDPVFLNTNRSVKQDSRIPLDIAVEMPVTEIHRLKTGEILVDHYTGVKHLILDKNQTRGVVRLQQISPIFRNPSSLFHSENDKNDVYNVTKILSIPLINKYSGKTFYVVNKPGFRINEEQYLSIRAYISFESFADI